MKIGKHEVSDALVGRVENELRSYYRRHPEHRPGVDSIWYGAVAGEMNVDRARAIAKETTGEISQLANSWVSINRYLELANLAHYEAVLVIDALARERDTRLGLLSEVRDLLKELLTTEYKVAGLSSEKEEVEQAGGGA